MWKLLTWVTAGRWRKQTVSNSPNILYRLGFWLACQILVFPYATLAGQSLRLSSASASRGDRVAIELSLESPAGKEPLALQWEIYTPLRTLSLVDDTALEGPAAEQANKSVRCAVKGKSSETYTSVCILSGGQKPIQNGVIAFLRLRISPSAQTDLAQVRVERAVAVSRDLKQVALDPAETAVAIRK